MRCTHKDCKHRSPFDHSTTMCNYIDTGKSRGCLPEDCGKYEKKVKGKHRQRDILISHNSKTINTYKKGAIS